MIRAILLDAAGTLIRPAEPVSRVYARHFAALVEARVEVERLEEAFPSAFRSAGLPDYEAHAEGDSAERAWWRRVVAMTAERAGVKFADGAFEACFRRLFDHYAESAAWAVYPEVRECLGRWRTEGFKLAVVSNFDRRLHRLLDALALAPFFDAVICSADVRARKPDPAIFRHALRLLGVSSVEAAHIGDCPVADVEGAARSGMAGFGLDRPAVTLEEAARWLDGKFCPK